MNAMSPPPGLPRAAQGETVLWRGAPCWRSLARRLCHLRGISLYLGLVTVGTGVVSALEGDTLEETLLTTLPLLVAGLLTVGFLALLAWRIARTTAYTLTTHRLVIRFGVALPATLAIPHSGILRASVTVHRDHTGDLPLVMQPGFRVALHRVWPHSRPWRFVSPQPMLRSVPRAGQVAVLLAQTLAQGAWRASE